MCLSETFLHLGDDCRLASEEIDVLILGKYFSPDHEKKMVKERGGEWNVAKNSSEGNRRVEGINEVKLS